MADIRAFRGLLYNPEKISTLEEVVAPPYDVINEERREALYARHPANVVRLILGRELEGDTGKVNKYTRARDFLSTWTREKTLLRDEKPALYLYDQSYHADGIKKVRRGFMAAVKLEAFERGIILPHEATLAKPVADRLKLFRATQCNLSPVFGLYSDKERRVDDLLKGADAMPPFAVLEGEDGTRHEMRKLTEENTVHRITALFQEKKIILADGHHRYTTALAYKREMDEKRGPNPAAPYNNVLMYLTNMYGDGLSVGPIHRIIHGVEIDRGRLKKDLEALFDVEVVNGRGPECCIKALADRLRSAAGQGISFALYFGGGESWFLQQRADVNLADTIAIDGPEELRRLDVTVAHSLLIEGALKISREDIKGQRHLIYKKDPLEAASLVDSGAAQLACLMNPTRVDQVEAIAGRGYLMPQKSTFFYPKLLTGLVMAPLS